MATLEITLEALQFMEPEELTAAAKRAGADELLPAALRTFERFAERAGLDTKTLTPASMWYYRTAVELFAERLAMLSPGAVIERQQNHGLYVSPLKHLGPRGTFSLTLELAFPLWSIELGPSPRRIRETVEQELTWILRQFAYREFSNSANTAHARAVSRWRTDEPSSAAVEVQA